MTLVLSGAAFLVSAEDFYHYYLYLVKPGDTISQITQTFLPGQIYGPDGSMQKVFLCNPSIKNNPDLIFPGEQILLDTSDQQHCAPKTSFDELYSKTEPKTEENLPAPTPKITLKPTTFSMGIGYTSLTYKETGTLGLALKAITAKASYRRPLAYENFDFGSSMYFTLFPLETKPNISGRFLGINLRVGWTVPHISSTWQLTLMGGWHYTTMFVSGNALGFHGLQGPQFYSMLQRSLTPRDIVSTYLKYALISNGPTLMPLSNREIAIGGGWARGLKNGHAISCTLDWLDLFMKAGFKTVKARSLSLSSGYSW